MSNKEEKIIEVATALFSQYGYHAVGVDRIVAESQVAKMTFYKYFPSKETLIEKVLYTRNLQIRNDIVDFISNYPTPLARLKAVFEWHQNWFQSPNFHGCMFIKAIDEYPNVHSTMRIAAKEYKMWLKSIIADQLREIGGKKAVELSPLVLLVLDGLTINCNLFESSINDQVQNSWQQIQNLLKTVIKK